jgi:hypothetical protein
VEAGIMTRKTQSPRRMLAVVSLASLAAVAGGLALWQDQQLNAAASAKAKAAANTVLAQRNAALAQQNAFMQQLANMQPWVLTGPQSRSSAERDAASERMMIRDLLYRRNQWPERMQFQTIPNYDPSGLWRTRRN